MSDLGSVGDIHPEPLSGHAYYVLGNVQRAADVVGLSR
jgi:hypothetical protein